MRTSARLLTIALFFALPVAGFTMGHGSGHGNGHGKGKPQPIPCPADVGSGLAAQCPCAGTMEPNNPDPNAPVTPWRNHGQYVKCVVHYRNALRKSGCLTDVDRRTLASCAARSTCGKSNKSLCCHYDLGTCSDPMPGDMTAAGTCSNDPNAPCDTGAECTTSSARIVRDPNSCTADGDVVVVGGGSVCSPCPPPAP